MPFMVHVYIQRYHLQELAVTGVITTVKSTADILCTEVENLGHERIHYEYQRIPLTRDSFYVDSMHSKCTVSNHDNIAQTLFASMFSSNQCIWVLSGQNANTSR